MTSTRPRTFVLPSSRADRRRGAGLLLSLLAHAALLALALRAGRALWAPTPAAGDPLGLGKGGGGGGGGGGVRGPVAVYILPPPPAPPEASPVVPVAAPPPTAIPPAVSPPAPIRPPSDTVAAASAAADSGGVGPGSGPGEGPGSGGGTGGGTGGGVGTGTGPGSGPGSGGEGGVITSPVWSAGALPFGQTPKSLRGRHVDVTFWVRADGRVERTSVAPPIDDVEYLKYFQQVMQTFRFRPARDPSGAAVPGTVTMGFELPSK